MKLVVLGKGFIGTHLFKFLNEKVIDVTFLGRNDLDYGNYDTLQLYLTKNRPDYVINCCGYTGLPNVDACETNKNLCIEYNLNVPLVLNKVCNDNCIRLIHVSSGCIYSGYEKQYTEEDEPNFGLTNPVSSFYSKCKHIFEISTKPYFNTTAVIRIRMPFTNKHEPKNYLYKLYKYNNLISLPNSLSYVDDLNRFILFLCTNFSGGIFNVVNTGGVDAKSIVDIFKSQNLVNPNWSFVELENLQLKASRSNCILSNDKIKRMGFTLTDTIEAVKKCAEDLAKNEAN